MSGPVDKLGRCKFDKSRCRVLEGRESIQNRIDGQVRGKVVQVFRSGRVKVDTDDAEGSPSQLFCDTAVEAYQELWGGTNIYESKHQPLALVVEESTD